MSRTNATTSRRARPHALALVVLLAAALLPACVKRTISITSEPPGALVYLNDVELGRTPVDADFTFFGTYDVRLNLDGYEPLVTKKDAVAPFYEYPGPDLIAEAMPFNIHTHLKWHFTLEPTPESQLSREEMEAQLIARANELRTRLRNEVEPPIDLIESPPPAINE